MQKHTLMPESKPVSIQARMKRMHVCKHTYTQACSCTDSENTEAHTNRQTYAHTYLRVRTHTHTHTHTHKLTYSCTPHPKLSNSPCHESSETRSLSPPAKVCALCTRGNALIEGQDGSIMPPCASGHVPAVQSNTTGEGGRTEDMWIE